MLRLPLFLLFSLRFFGIAAQDLHIYYDAFSDSVYYTQNGKPVDRPAVRKGRNVILHVTNYNNYLYNVQVKTEQKNILIAQGNPLDTGLLIGSGSGNPLDLLLGGGGAIGSLSNLFGLKSSGGVATQAELDRQARVEDLKAQVSAFNAVRQRLEDRAEEITAVQNDMQTVLEGQQIQNFVADELERIRFNPRLEPRQIKNLSREYMSRIFGVDDPDAINLSKVLEKADVGSEFSGLRKNYEGQVAKYAKDVVTLKVTGLALTDPKFNFQESNVDEIRKEADGVIAASEKNLETYQENIKTLEAKSADIKSLDVEKLTGLRTTYLTVMDNDFSKTHRQQADGDAMDLQLVFTPVDSENIAGVATKTIAPIAVNVYGGLQVNASVGLSFGQFFSASQDFFVRDSVIRSSNKDAFTPFLTSFVHFYPQSLNTVSIGGSFGVGIPLGGQGSSLESISFFLGPSLVLGRQQRIVLSGGLMGGKVKQLTNGYEVGDLFEADPELLQTESVYKLGYYVGISFNLVGNK